MINSNVNNQPDQISFSALLEKIDFLIDKDYLEFIRNHNGAAGFLNDENYTLLWNIEDLIALNPYYKDEPMCADYFFFGSDGSDLGYAFKKSNGKIVGVDFLEIGNIEPTNIAESFELFIQKLSD